MKYNENMNENIKETIARESRELFNKYGYQKVTMREIANACGISVGNLTYHYPHKEDLLMLEHDGILNAFLSAALSDESALSGLAGYFTVECAFLRRIMSDPPVARLYSQVVNVPNLRDRYYTAHHKLYLHFSPEDDTPASRRATVAMCALEFSLSDTGILSEDFEAGMRNVFSARLLFAGKNAEDYAGNIRSGVEEGVRLAERLKDIF